jgi:hypothetical protein
MSKTDKLNDLFFSWRKTREEYSDKFVLDGIINENCWNEAQKKVLFLLKEPNKDTSDFRTEVKRGPWPVPGCWAYGLMNSRSDRIVPFEEANADHNRRQACIASAIMNLKKTPGGGSSRPGIIEEYSKHDSQYIVEEIKIIDPDIIVCGGTFQVFRTVNEPASLKMASYRCWRYEGKICMDFCHPSARFPHYMMYYTLMALYQQCPKVM